MKERVDSTKVLREPNVNGPSQELAVAGGVTKLDCADIKAEVKEEDGRKSGDSRPPSRKIPNGETDAKIENGKPGSVSGESQKSSPQSTTPQHPSSGGTTPATIMPQHGMVPSLEPPFMQHQNKVFVFSTRLANEAAESVRQGLCKSIIQYHMDHPNTKNFLQKNPLKASSFRHSMAPGVVGCMKGGQQGPGMIRMPGPSPPGWGPQHPSAIDGMMGPEGMMLNGPYHPGGPGPRMMGNWPGQGCGGLHPHPHGPMGPGGYPLGSMMDIESEMMMAGAHNPSNISSSQIPDENLTLEQRQHRSRGLAQLTKIHKMLLGAGNPAEGQQAPPLGHEPHPSGPGMYHGGPGMMSQQQQVMMSQHAMMSQAGMIPPHGMMSPQHQHMMSQQSMTPYGPRGPAGINGKEQYQAQHDWYQVQREFFMEKQHRMVAMRGPHMEPVPPPPYYSTVSQKHSGMNSPPSPGMNGMRVPMPGHSPMGPGMPPMGSGMDPESMAMFGGPPDMCRPPHIGMEPMPGMHIYPPHMQPQGPMDTGFDPMMVGGMPSGMGPGHPGLGPRHHGPMRQSHMMGSNGVMPSMKGPNQVTLHRAGNPEQFNPETMGGVVPPVQPPTGSGSNSKPPPSYAQAQKRKRGSDMDDSYTKGNLQQTPSPTKIHYHLSQFEGQELTITKQLNSAYVASDGGDDSGAASSAGSSNSSSGGGPISGGSSGLFNSHTSSPLHGPGSNKGPHSNSSQTSVHMVSSPVVSTTGPSPHQGPATPHSTTHSSTGPSSGANMRLSHFDPAPLSNGIGSSPHTPTPKSSSMSNITSASLANLAKGVENLSNQMQQNMMQGGPFHSIQVQGQMTSSGSNSSSNGSNSNSVSSTTATTTTSSSSPSTNSSSNPATSGASQVSGAPGASTAYLASNMAMAQSGMPPQHSSVNSYVNMQMQNMNSEPAGMNLPPCSMQHGIGPGMIPGGPRSGVPHHMTSAAMMMPMGANGPSPVMGPGLSMPVGHMPSGMTQVGPLPPHRPNSSSGMPATPPTITKSHFTSPPLSHPAMSGPGSIPDVGSPSFPITSSSNSTVQIQQKGHNTIQYLPANPPSTSQPAATKQRAELDYTMPRFPSPLHSLDGKNPSSTLQYFPSSPPTPQRPPHMSSALSAAAAMGPEFASQAAIAMHQSASMMRSPCIPDLQAIQGPGPGMPPSSVGPMGPSPGIPSSSVGPMGHSPMMGGPDSLMGMGHMRPGHSPGALHHMPSSLGPGGLECVSPIPGMGGYMSNGPSIEQAQAQAQAHAAMMMQGSRQLSVSSPHGPMPPCGGPSPHMTPLGPMPPCGGPSPHMTPLGPMPPCGGPSPHATPIMPMPGGSIHGSMPAGAMSGPSVHGHPMSGQSPHGAMSCSLPGTSPHGPISGPPLHGPMPGPPTHSSMMGPMPPHGHMGHLHGPAMPSGSMPRQPGMGPMRMAGPAMGNISGQYSMQYPGYQQEYYPSGSPRSHPRQMMPGMMGGPVQPYGMMP